MTTTFLSVLFASALSMLGCRNTAGAARPQDGGGDVAGGSGDFLPLQIGNAWTYLVTDVDGTVSSEVVSVVAEEPVGGDGPNSGANAFRVVTGNKINDPNGDLDWETLLDSRVVRYRSMAINGMTGNKKNEQSWDPPRLVVDETDEHTAASASWREPAYTEYATDWDTDPDGGANFIPDGGMTVTANIEDLWVVVSPSQSVTVPAGTFQALTLRRVGNGGSSIKNYWYVRGLGMVRQSEDGKPTHELSTFRILP
jgi:hypothetical protein